MDEEITVDDFIELLHMNCPCLDPDCEGTWLTRHEAYVLQQLLRKHRNALCE